MRSHLVGEGLLQTSGQRRDAWQSEDAEAGVSWVSLGPVQVRVTGMGGVCRVRPG